MIPDPSVAILKCDLEDSTRLGERLGAEREAECRAAYRNAVVQAVSSFDNHPGYQIFGGDDGVAFFQGAEASSRAVQAALSLVERHIVEVFSKFRARVRVSVGLDDAPSDARLNEVSPDDFNVAGHAVSANVCPPNAVCISENVHDDLRVTAPDLAKRFEFLGVTSRDGAAVFVSPRGERPAKPGGLREESNGLYAAAEAIRRYHSAPPFSQLRFFALPQFNFVGALNLLDVYTPVLLRRPEPIVDSRRLTEDPSDQRGRSAEAVQQGMPSPSSAISLAQAFASSDRLVLLGEPGSGKSTMLRFLAIVCAGGRTFARKHLDHAKRWLPLCLPAAELLDVDLTEGNFARMLANLFRSRVGASAAAVAQAIREAASAGRLCVLLDGLDEIPSSGDQIRVRNRIEQLSGLLAPGCQMVVSSRVVGYPGLAFPGRGEHVLEPLSREQTRGLIKDFYAQVEKARGLGEAEAGKEAESRGGSLARALEDRAGLGAFATNPLLLTIAALVHLQIGKLPQYRVKLYDIAVQTLVEAWSTARRVLGEQGISAAVDYEAEGRSVLTFLALYMQEHCAGGAR